MKYNNKMKERTKLSINLKSSMKIMKKKTEKAQLLMGGKLIYG